MFLMKNVAILLVIFTIKTFVYFIFNYTFVKRTTMRIRQHITPEQHETVILMYLKGCTKSEIVIETQISWWHVNNAIFKLESGTNAKSQIRENLDAIKRAELRIIALAEAAAMGKPINELDYSISLNCYATADLMNRSVFIP